MPTAPPATTAAGRETARILLDIKAVNFRPQAAYRLTSGWASPVYIDCRKLISFPDERRRVVALAVDKIEAEAGDGEIDAVAGGETAGIPYAAWIAEAMSLPMLYVRKEPKGFGRMAQIEGELKPESRVLLVEDLATDGESKLKFVEALRAAGAFVPEAFVIFFYGAFPGTLEKLAEAGLRLHYLATWWDVLAEVESGGDFDRDAIDEVAKFLGDPPAWSAAHGGRGGEG